MSNLEGEQPVCKLCRRQLSKYTCPTCNVPYCSLTCFRSPSHDQCSESFYKKELETSIHSEPSKTAEERSSMMQLLKRFEEENAEEDFDTNEDGNSISNLAERVKNINIASIASEELWSLLTIEERERFLKTVNNPASDLAQQLLASEEMEKQRQKPWWDNDDSSTGELEPMNLPRSMFNSARLEPSLVYNICSILLAYSFTIRHLSIPSLSSGDKTDRQQARRSMSQLVPFIVDRKSNVLHTSLSQVITDIWSRFNANDINQKLLAILLKDSAVLLRPRPVVPLRQKSSLNHDLVDVASHSHYITIFVLSDLWRLFQWNGGPSSSSYKMLFYAAHVLATPSLMLHTVATELLTRTEKAEYVSLSSEAADPNERVITHSIEEL